MNWRIAIAAHFLPDFIVKRKLQDLLKLTARAFDMEPPAIKNLTLEESVEKFAQFTRMAADIVQQQSGENQQRVKERLNDNAYLFGTRMRRLFNVKSIDDVMAVSTLLYKMLKIQFEGNRFGEIVIPQCFFSQYYSKKNCQLISSLDAGVIAGLSGGGILNFSQRITEGQSCCIAYLSLPVAS